MDDLDAVAVVDVTAEMLGERREEYRAGVDAGLRQGTQRVLQSEAIEAIASEVQTLRALVDAMTEVAHEREKVIDWYRSKYLELVRHIRARADERWGVDA